MKKISLLFYTMLTSLLLHGQTEVNSTWKSQITPIFEGLDKGKIPHGVLNDFAMEFTNVPAYNGTLTDTTYISANVLGSIYKTLFMGKVTTDTTYFPRMETIAKNWVSHRNTYNEAEQNTMVIAGLLYQYSRINSNALTNGKITVSDNKYYDKYVGGVWQNPYESLKTIAFTPAVNHYNKKFFGVVLPQDLMLSNNDLIESIQVNFNDGTGIKNVAFDQKVYANYTQNGTYDWVFRVTLSDGSVLYSQTKMEIEEQESQVQAALSLTSTITAAYDNNVFIAHPDAASIFAKKGAKLRIDYAPSHNGQIVKPFIVAEGFDSGTVLTPEIEGGDRTLEDFKNDVNSIFRAGELSNLIFNENTQQYDIIYIDWQNGTADIRENSKVLQQVLAWVNAKKQQAGSTFQNVLLGQSMGGVIGRYTLAKMEQDNISHDVWLFIAHDSPMQGANTPLSTQYFTRHMYDNYTEAPILYGTFEYLIPTVLNFVELLSLGNINVAFPSLNDVLTLQDTPAALQMNYHYVDKLSNPTMAIHAAWQQELEAMGYPQLSRNIAISNGNECAVDHGFNAGDKIISLHDLHNPDVFGDLLHMIITPAIGTLVNDFTLVILGVLPGSSKYFFDFDIHTNPAINATDRKVYDGKIRYEKKLLWMIKISHTITERTKNAPSDYLPFDTYSGGYYNITNITDNIPFSIPSNSFVNIKYGFIPVVSALDIKRNNSNVNSSDYLKTYHGGVVNYSGLSTSFDNFIVDFNRNNPINNAHISFQTRNGNWLAKELNEENNLTEDCSNFCSNAAINGISTLCTSSIYSVTNEATSCTWSITEGNSIVTYIINGNEITLTKVNGQSGYVTLNATYSNTKCGSATISKRIWVGTPKITNNTLNGHTTTSPMTIESYYVNSPGQGIVDYQWTIEVVNLSSDCTCTINSDGLIICPSGTSLARFYESGTTTYTTTSPMATVDFRTCKGQYLIKLVARNSCGSTLVTSSYITIKSAQDCDTSLKAFPNPVTDNELTVVMRPAPGDPCGDDVITLKVNNEEKEPIKIYDFYGNIVYSGTIERGENKISDLNLKSGNYILNVFAKTGEVIREVIIVK